MIQRWKNIERGNHNNKVKTPNINTEIQPIHTWYCTYYICFGVGGVYWLERVWRPYHTLCKKYHGSVHGKDLKCISSS